MKRPDLLKHKDAFINSMEVLVGRYKRAMARGISKVVLEREDGESCLLCDPIGIEENRYEYGGAHREACSELGCPWMVMEELTCDEWSSECIDGTWVYASTDPAIQQARIDQLKEWIEAYKNFEEAK